VRSLGHDLSIMRTEIYGATPLRCLECCSFFWHRVVSGNFSDVCLTAVPQRIGFLLSRFLNSLRKHGFASAGE
jgi:hypothetical protein